MKDCDVCFSDSDTKLLKPVCVEDIDNFLANPAVYPVLEKDPRAVFLYIKMRNFIAEFSPKITDPKENLPDRARELFWTIVEIVERRPKLVFSATTRVIINFPIFSGGKIVIQNHRHLTLVPVRNDF